MNEQNSIRLGVDFGSTTCRAAYLLPGADAVVTVPLAPERFTPLFPLAEPIGLNDPYSTRFFPGVVQRLFGDFAMTAGSGKTSIHEVVSRLVQQVADCARSFAGMQVQAMRIAHPIWIDDEGRDILRDAAQIHGGIGLTCTDVEAASAFFLRNQPGIQDRHVTLVVLCAGFAGMSLAVIRAAPRGIRVLSSTGCQEWLAGNIFDFAILQTAVYALRDAGIMYTDIGSTIWSYVQAHIEAAKRPLWEGKDTTLEIPAALTPLRTEPIHVVLHARKFLEFAALHVRQTTAMVDSVLAEAGVGAADVEFLLLEGGSAHLTGLAGAMKERCPAAEVVHLPPDAVAQGAALRTAGLNPRDFGEVASPVPCPAGQRDFFPKMFSVPGLVSVPDTGGKPADEGTPSAIAVDPAPPVPEPEFPDVDSLSIGQIREWARRGEKQRASRALLELKRAVEHELTEPRA